MRLPAGGRIDRARPLAFRFDGRYYSGFAGDTLASALLANGVRLVGRSFKHHRPRGVFTAGPEEPNALVELGRGAERTPNTRATTTELREGLEAFPQNCWPSLRFDLMAVNGLLAPLFAAGFYYKTFMWPSSFWEKVYEPLIRRAAGLGRLSGAPDPGVYDKVHDFCDVLVIGAGPAGLAAALAAGRSGARVILAEEDFELGGRLLGDRAEIAGGSGSAWAASVAGELKTLAETRVLRRTAVFGVYDGGTYGALEQGPAGGVVRCRYRKIVARRCVLASGALERPLVFADNDRPGVMLASAARTYVNRFAAAPGRRAVVFTTSDDGWRTAADLTRAGVAVAAVVDPRSDVGADVTALAGDAERLTGAAVARALGGAALRGVEVAGADGARRVIACDLLAVSGGWSPNLALTAHLGARPVWSAQAQAFAPGATPEGLRVAGAAAGRFTTAEALADGFAAGAEAAEACGFPALRIEAPGAGPEAARWATLRHIANARGKSYLDLQHDVTASDIDLAHREGFRAPEHVKRYTTLGMATDQGRLSSHNGLALLAQANGAAIGEQGPTTHRPPYAPVPIAAFAGAERDGAFRPVRHTPTHAWAERRGAVFVEAGLWLRAQYFPNPGERDWQESVTREVRAVRNGVGFCDVSTLGKIELFGPDVATFLERLYTNAWANLAVGRARYGLMLREDGIVLDDGTTSRLGPEHYVMTTTTANAARVFQHMEFARQVLWPELDVQMVSATDQWAQIAIAGPLARETLARVLDPGFDLSDAAFPYMAAAETTVLAGAPARVFRVSFSGERGYELAAPARLGEALADALMAVGAPFAITPYGVEALGVMRIEKGHPAGPELNGQTTPGDLGLAKLLSRRKDYIGRRLGERPGLTDPDRQTLVGLKPIDRSQRLRAGGHLVREGAPASAAHDEGHVTSTAYSPTLGHSIALALLARGAQRLGERVRIVDPLRGGEVVAEVCAPVFVDPGGERLRG